MHEMHGTHAIAAWCGRGKLWWTGCGFSDMAASAKRYRGNHEAMATVTRMRRDALKMRAMQVSIVPAPKISAYRNEQPPRRIRPHE